MKILVTGARGFIAKNLISELKNQKYNDILEYNTDSDPFLLDKYTKEADFVFHLAGVTRPNNQEEYMKNNFEFTSTLLNKLKKHANTCPVMFSSSIHAVFDSPYGQSKKAEEDLMFEHAVKTGAKVLVYRFTNVFGKWCRPNYCSVIATFCHNIANDLPITVNGHGTVMNLCYIDDVVFELINALNGKESVAGDFCRIPVVYRITLGEIVDLIYTFKKSSKECAIPNVPDGFAKKLYSTYVSYLPQD